MTVTPTMLTRGAAAAAVAAGVIFIGVQIAHPHLDADSITTTEMEIRSTLKALMAVLALAGITGMYLVQVRQAGVLGLIGYLVLSTGYLLIMSTALIAGYVLPTIADTNRSYVDDVIDKTTGDTPTGDIGLLQYSLTVQDLCYLAGGLIFGIALYRARVLARWASALLAIGGVVTIAIALMPDAFYRLLAYPNGIAMIGLGYSLWVTARTVTTDATPTQTPTGGQQASTAGVE